MLTRDLLHHRTRKGAIRPLYVKVDDPELRSLADDLVLIVGRAVGAERRELMEGLDARSKGFKRQKIAKGLVKLLLDRMTFEDPGEDAAVLRRTAFIESRKVMTALAPEASIADFERELADRLEQPLEEVRTVVYADLAEHRRLLAWKELDGAGLLERYNLALAQGLVMFARRVSVTFAAKEVVVMRRVLRWLKFCRLVAELEKTERLLTLHIDGPAALFSSTKKYGVQLATFVQIVPLLPAFSLNAVVELPKRDAVELTITHEDGLVSPLVSGVGHVPEEVTAVLCKLEDDETWRVSLEAAPRTVGAGSWCVPDLCFVHRSTGDEIGIELFHSWHANALLRRLDELDSRPDERLFLGVERSVAKKSDVATRIDGRNDVFLFNKFPSVRAIQGILTHRAEALARSGD